MILEGCASAMLGFRGSSCWMDHAELMTVAVRLLLLEPMSPPPIRGPCKILASQWLSCLEPYSLLLPAVPGSMVKVSASPAAPRLTFSPSLHGQEGWRLLSSPPGHPSRKLWLLFTCGPTISHTTLLHAVSYEMQGDLSTQHPVSAWNPQ